MSTTAKDLSLQIKIDLNTLGRTIDFAADHSTDYRDIAPNQQLAQISVHTLRFINGQSEIVSGSQRWRVFRLKLDFWFRLLTGIEENFIVGYAPVGLAHVDFNKYADRAYWRDVWESDPLKAHAVAFVDDENPPILAIQREGNIMHWSVNIGLVCPP